MSGKKKVRIVLDALLTVMLVFEMFIQYTGELLHEVVGFAFFATIIAHIALSARWMRGTAGAAKTGTLHGKRAALAVMAALLAITVVVLGVSSVAISGLLASAGLVWTLGSYATWVTVHAFSAYALCALVVVHLAMHWAFLASALRVPYDPGRRRAIGTSVHVAAAVGALALGAMAVREGMPMTASAMAGDTAGATASGAASSGEAVSRSEGASSGSGGSASADSTDASSGPSSAYRSGDSDEPANSGASGSSGRSGKSHGGKRSHMRGSADDASGAPSGARASDGASSGATDGSQDAASGGSQSSTGDSRFGGGGSSADDTSGYQSGDSGGSSAASGICTLCRKQCPLSAPRCDKPYEAGLI